MLIATISWLNPAVGRWPSPIFQGPIVMAVTALYVLLVAGFDLWSLRRVHRATWQGGLFMITAHQLMRPMDLTSVWH